jgi:hypothetical protein
MKPLSVCHFDLDRAGVIASSAGPGSEQSHVYRAAGGERGLQERC